MEFRIHWFALTIHAPNYHGQTLWNDWFSPILGSMQSSGHGGRGFRSLYESLAGAKLYCDPAMIDKDDFESQYVHIELPGDACDAIPNELFREFLMELLRHEKFNITRLDLAWDGVKFTPKEVEEAINENQIRTLAKRRTMSFTTSSWEQKDTGDLGTSSLKLGSRYSSRMIRTYDKRGPVRMEFQVRNKRAHAIATTILIEPVKHWSALAIAHLRDYIDFTEKDSDKLLPWWEEFINDIGRAMLTVSDARQAELERMIEWVDKQVAATLSVIHDVYGEELILMLIKSGRQKRGKRYDTLLSKAKGRS